VKTAIVSALVMYALASVISLGVALLIKVLFIAIRRVNRPR
jgi:hypothetical protein